MTITVEYITGTQSVSTTEWSLVNDSSTIATNTTPGIYQLWLDLSALAAGDIFVLTGYEKVRTGDTQRKFMVATFADVQATPNTPPPTFILGIGWDFTLIRTGGADRTINWCIRQVG